jgi:hypothetical protein
METSGWPFCEHQHQGNGRWWVRSGCLTSLPAWPLLAEETKMVQKWVAKLGGLRFDRGSASIFSYSTLAVGVT